MFNSDFIVCIQLCDNVKLAGFSLYNNDLSKTISFFIWIVTPCLSEVFQDMSIPSDEKLEISVKVIGTPIPNVVWLKDDVAIENNKEFMFGNDGDRFYLIHKKVSSSEEGTYTVRASNLGGKAESSAKIKVIQFPAILAPLCDTDVIEGKNGHLKVSVCGIPSPIVTWFKDGIKISNDKHYKISFSGNDAFLEVVGTVQGDSGTYSITASNHIGEAKSSAVLNVNNAPEVEDIANQSVIIGGSLMLKSTFTGQPPPTITWLRNDVPIGQNEHFQLETSQSSCTLKKNEVNLDDEGLYTLIIENKAGKTNVSCQVSVLIPPFFEEVSSYSSFKDQTMLEDEDLQLNTALRGKPSPSLLWLKDGEELKPGNKRVKLSRDKDNISLLVKKVVPSDSGKYQCSIKNEAGEKTIEAVVVVNSKPKVLKKMKDAIIIEGEKLLLETQILGDPEPTIVWYKDDGPLPDHLKPYSTDDNHFLCLEDVKHGDSGVYSVVAQNLVGDCKTSSKVKVLKAPVFEKPLSDVTITQKQALKLHVEVDGSPEPDIVWLKDGNPIQKKKSSSAKYVFHKEGNNHSLSIANVSLEDQGIYTIIAKNQAGEIRCQSSVVVQGNCSKQCLLLVIPSTNSWIH